MKQKIIKVVAFLLIGVVLFGVVQEILTPTHQHDGVDKALSGFYSLEDNTIDVLFLGSSHVVDGISPMAIYEDTGIRSYNLASGAQPLECSYYLLQQVFKTQSPKAVFLDLSNAFVGDGGGLPVDNSYFRYILDNDFNLSKNYFELADAYDDIPKSDGYWSAFFPIIKYHTRWNELSAKDFKLKENESLYYSMGQSIKTYSNDSNSLSTVNTLTDSMQLQGEGWRKEYQDGGYVENSINKKLYWPELNPSFFDYFVRMKKLCDEYGADLILFKVPTHDFYSGHSWTYVKSEIIERFADQFDVVFLDLMSEDLVDASVDFFDTSRHLNIWGAEKVSRYLGSYLLENYDNLNRQRNTEFDAALEMYQKVRELAELQRETDFGAFLEMLIENKDNWAIYISSQNNYSDGLTEAESSLLKQLGLTLIEEGSHGDAYLAVINKGTVVYEGLSDRKIIKNLTVGHQYASLAASSYLDIAGGTSSYIQINGTNYSLSSAGLNFVIWDNETNRCIHCISFDTSRDQKTGIVNTGRIYSLFTAYEDYLISLS